MGPRTEGKPRRGEESRAGARLMDAGSANSRPPRFERGCAGANPAPAASLPGRLRVGRGALNAEMVVRCHLREPIRRSREPENPAACKAAALSSARQGQHLEPAPRKGSEVGEETVSKTAGRASGLWDRHPPLPPVLRGRPGGRGGPLIEESRRIAVRRAGLLNRSGSAGGGSSPSLSARLGRGPRSCRRPHRDKSGLGSRPAAPAASGLGIRTLPPS